MISNKQSGFKPQDTFTSPGLAKFVAGTGVGPVLEKEVGRGESELGIAGRVSHRNGDQVIHDLSQVIPSVYAALPADSRLLTQSQKEELLARVIEAMRSNGTHTEYGELLARRIVGLDSGMAAGETFVSGRPGTSHENGGYRVPPEPANTPSYVAKSADMDDFMRQTRAQIQVIASRIQALVEKNRAR
jgi:hypothetical protein